MLLTQASLTRNTIPETAKTPEHKFGLGQFIHTGIQVCRNILSAYREDIIPSVLYRLRADHASSLNQGEIAFYGKTTPEFRADVVAEYRSFPAYARAWMRAKRGQLMVGGIVDDIDPEKGKSFRTSHRDDHRTHQNQSSGSYGRGQIFITQIEYFGERPKIGETPTLIKLLFGGWTLIDRKELANTMRHEGGHAIDDLVSHGNYISCTPAFTAAYRRDIARLGGPDVAREKGYGYYVQPEFLKGARGRNEVFAESWGAINGGGCRDREILGVFTDCASLVSRLHSDLEHAYAEGGVPAVDDAYFDAINTYLNAEPCTVSVEKAFEENADAQKAMRESGKTRILEEYGSIIERVGISPETTWLVKQFAHYMYCGVQGWKPGPVSRDFTMSALRTTPISANIKGEIRNMLDMIDVNRKQFGKEDIARQAQLRDSLVRSKMQEEGEIGLLRAYDSIITRLQITPETGWLAYHLMNHIFNSLRGYESNSKKAGLSAIDATPMPDDLRGEIRSMLDMANMIRVRRRNALEAGAAEMSQALNL